MSSTSDAIRSYINHNYPCAALPHGALTAIGLRFDVSREYVRQIVKAMGYGKPVTGQGERVACAGGCGRTYVPGYEPKGGWCRACQWVELPCVQCGAPVRRRAKELANRMSVTTNIPGGGTANYTGRVFCNRRCFGLWFGYNHRLGPSRKGIPTGPRVPRVEVPCSQCGAPLIRKASKLAKSKEGRAFCNPTCTGRWLSKHPKARPGRYPKRG